MLSSFKNSTGEKPNGTGGYLDYLFDNQPKYNSKGEEIKEDTTKKIDSNKLRSNVSAREKNKSLQNKKKKYPYVYGPKLPQLDSKHLYHLDDVTSEDENLTIIDHPNQPNLPKSIPKRDNRQTKASTKIKGKLAKLNNKQDALINRTTVYDDVYDPSSEKKETKGITNPITKPVYKFIGKLKNDADLKQGKKTKYISSQPKNPIWNRFSKDSTTGVGDTDEKVEVVEDEGDDKEEEEEEEDYAKENEEGPGTLDPKLATADLLNKERSEESIEKDIKENEEGPDAVDPAVHDLTLNKTRTAEEIEKDIKENEEGPIPIDPAIHELSLNKTRTAEEIEKDIKENEEGPIPIDPAIHELSLNKTRTAEEIEKDIKENEEGPDAAENPETDETAVVVVDDSAVAVAPTENYDDVESKISYNPVFFIDKKANKTIVQTFETPLAAIGTKFKNLSAYSSKKKDENLANLTSLDELKSKQEEDTQRLTALMDEIIVLQEQCQPLHFKKLDELERLNHLAKFHHKVDLYKHEQEKLQIAKKVFEKEQRHRARDINRSERTNIRKQRDLQKQKRDLKKEELRGLRRHQRKLNHFEEMKKKFITDVPTQTFDAPVFDTTADDADDEEEPEVVPGESVASPQEEEKAAIEVVSSSAENATEAEPKSIAEELENAEETVSKEGEVEDAEPKDVAEEGEGDVEAKEEAEAEEEDQSGTKEYVEPDTQEEYDNKIKEIGQEFAFISKEPLITHEEEKELSKLKQKLNEKKIEVNTLAASLNNITTDMNNKLSLISDFKPPADSKIASPSLEDIKAPALFAVVPAIEKDFEVLTDNELQLSQPSDIEEIPEYVPKLSSDESELSPLQISSSDIGPETDSESEGETNETVPIGYKGVLPRRGFLRTVVHSTTAAAVLRRSAVPYVYNDWVINEGPGPDDVPAGFLGMLPQRKNLFSIPHDVGNAAFLGTAAVPSIFEKWVINEGPGADEIPTGYKGVLPQRKLLSSIPHDVGNAAFLGSAVVPKVYAKWVINEGPGADDIPTGYKGVLPQRKLLSSIPHDVGKAAFLGSAVVPSVYDKWVIHEGSGDDEIPTGFRGILPQRKFLSTIPHDSASATSLGAVVVPAVFDKWVINEGTGADEIPTGYRGVLPQRKNLSSIPHDLGNAAFLGTAVIPSVYSKWEPQEGNGIENIPKGFKDVLPIREKLSSAVHDASAANALGDAAVPSAYGKWAVNPSASDDKKSVLSKIKPNNSGLDLNKENLSLADSDLYSTYTEEEVFTVSSSYKLNEKVL